MSAARASMAPPAVLGFVALAQGGAIALALVAWIASATKASPTGQIPWIVLAVLAVAVSGPSTPCGCCWPAGSSGSATGS